MNINIKKIQESRIGQLDMDNIPFARIYSDHMYIVDYENGEWINPRIVPYENLRLSPANQALHYGVSVFEGMKAYKLPDGNVALFRPKDNHKRLNISADRLCMPPVSEELFMEGMTEMLKLDSAWVPSNPGTALYVRPFMFCSEEFIGIKICDKFTFMIITTPVGAYYSQPVKVKIEMEYARAVKGGTGYAKAAGNYAGALYPTKLAAEEGYQQLIWTDAIEHKYIEEAGTMNLLFEIDGKIVTPELTDTFLHGITRDSILKLSRHLGFETEERKITVDEVVDALQTGRMTDAFGVGTAATLTHISEIGYKGNNFKLPGVESRDKSLKLQETIEGIKTGRMDDPFGWVYQI